MAGVQECRSDPVTLMFSRQMIHRVARLEKNISGINPRCLIVLVRLSTWMKGMNLLLRSVEATSVQLNKLFTGSPSDDCLTGGYGIVPSLWVGSLFWAL